MFNTQTNYAENHSLNNFQCVINGLLSGTAYQYTVKITFKGGAVWNSVKEYTFETLSPPEPDVDSKTIELDIPQLENSEEYVMISLLA